MDAAMTTMSIHTQFCHYSERAQQLATILLAMVADVGS